MTDERTHARDMLFKAAITTHLTTFKALMINKKLSFDGNMSVDGVKSIIKMTLKQAMEAIDSELISAYVDLAKTPPPNRSGSGESRTSSRPEPGRQTREA